MVTALLTMGISTVCIGLLPTYASIGVLAAGLLAFCRLGQGVGYKGPMLGKTDRFAVVFRKSAP